MSRRFEGMAALVTGAASGIGRATAKLLAGEGARVACADIGEEKLAEATEEIREGGGEAIAIALDVADSDSCNAAVARCIDEWGGLGVLANVAGVLKLEHADQLSDEDWTRVIGINLSGTFFMSRAAIPHLLDGGGSIVNVASLAGLKGQAYGSAYCASKAGVVALTRVMAVEYAKRGLRVNCVCPGVTDTPVFRYHLSKADNPDAVLAARTERIPLGRLNSPEDIARTVAFLLSDEAAGITGALVPVAAGLSPRFEFRSGAAWGDMA